MDLRDLALVVAGGIGIFAALIHGWLGETKIIAPTAFPNRTAKSLVRWIWQLSTLTWIGASVMLILVAQPHSMNDEMRRLVVAIAAAPLLYSAIGNAVVSRGRHFGWVMLGLVVALAAYGGFSPDPTPVSNITY